MPVAKRKAGSAKAAKAAKKSKIDDEAAKESKTDASPKEHQPFLRRKGMRNGSTLSTAKKYPCLYQPRKAQVSSLSFFIAVSCVYNFFIQPRRALN